MKIESFNLHFLFNSLITKGGKKYNHSIKLQKKIERSLHMKKSEIKYFTDTKNFSFVDINKRHSAGEIWHMYKATPSFESRSSTSSSFKSRPYLLVSNEHQMPYDRVAGVMITSNFTSINSIPIVINSMVSFIDPVYHAVFSSEDFDKRRFCGSVPMEVLEMTRYNISRCFGGKYNPDMELLINTYQKKVLELLEKGILKARKQDGTIETKMREALYEYCHRNDAPLGIRSGLERKSHKLDDIVIEKDMPSKPYIKEPEDEVSEMVYSSGDEKFTIGSLIPGLDDLLKSSENPENDNAEKEIAATSITDNEDDNKIVPLDGSIKLTGTYFTKEGRGRGRKLVLKRPSSLTIKEAAEYLTDMIKFDTYADFGRMFGTTGQTIRNRAMLARDCIKSNNVEIPSDVDDYINNGVTRRKNMLEHKMTPPPKQKLL